MRWIALPDLFIHDRTVSADFRSLTILTLLGFHEFDPALPVPMVVPVDEPGRVVLDRIC